MIFVLLFHSLLADQILAHVDRAGDQDDQALDDIEHVGVHCEEVQAGEDDLQEQYAYHDTADASDTSDKGNAADHACRDRVTLVVETCVCICRSDARAVQESGDAVHHAREHEYHDDGAHDIDA